MEPRPSNMALIERRCQRYGGAMGVADMLVRQRDHRTFYIRGLREFKREGGIS